jgi:hypothetical protein
VRTALAVFVEAWRGLTLDQKNVWAQLASGMIKGKESDARMNRGGLISVPRGPFSGYNAYIACNLNRYTYGYSVLTDILEDAPLGRALPEPLLSFAVTKAGRELTAAWTYINPGPLEERLGIWIRSVDAGIHPQMIYTEARNADGSTVIAEARRTSGIDVTLPNGVYQLQAIIVNQYGLTTAPSELVLIQLGGADVFTYFAVREPILNLDNQVTPLGPIRIELSALIPDGAHSAIVLVQISQVTAGTAGAATLRVRKDLFQGASIVLEVNRSPTVPNMKSDCAIMGIHSNRTIEYDMDYSGDAQYDLDIYLLGYVE